MIRVPPLARREFSPIKLKPRGLMYKTYQCLNCTKEFQARPQDRIRGFAKFCESACFQQHRIENLVQKSPNVECALCQTPFYLNESKKKNSKSGLFFCCREHKDQSQRIGGIEEIQPPHYGIGKGEHSYRGKAFASLSPECIMCGYGKYESVLQVHHKDKDRSNNDLSNLEFLCPTHHTELHYRDRGWI